MSGKTKEPFNRRAFVSVLTGFSFVVMTVTGLVLFFAPSCRIARDTAWVVWGHNKDQWAGVHVWFSIAFVVASLFHTYLNWSALINYFRTKLKQGLAFLAELISALVICDVVYAGAVGEVAPFSSLMIWKETFKHGAAGEGQQDPAWRGGRAGGHQGGNLSDSVEGNLTSRARDLNGHGGNYEQRHSEQEQQQFEFGGELQTHARGAGSAQGGMGRKTLRQFCRDERIELSWAISRLRNEDFTVRDTMTMREIADVAGVHPRELRNILQSEL